LKALQRADTHGTTPLAPFRVDARRFDVAATDIRYFVRRDVAKSTQKQ
jgi:hypothetical protein